MGELTDVKIRKAKVKPKEYTLKDGKGLFLRILPNSSRYWFYRFTWEKKQARVFFGCHPEVSLKEARIERDKTCGAIANGIDPRCKPEDIENKSEKGPTFAEFFPEWSAFKLKQLGSKPSKEKKNGGCGSTAIQIERYYKKDMLPILGAMPMKSITRIDTLAVQRKIEERGALSISEKVRGWLCG